MRRKRGAFRGIATILGVIPVTVALAAPAPASTGATAAVTVELDRHAYADGTHRASFVVEGACVEPSPNVELSSATCAGGVERAEGSLRSALLGFDAVHTVEALPVDIPLAQTDSGLPGDQLSVVRVDVPEPASLVIRVSAAPDGGFSARPVPSESKPPVTHAGADWVVWEVDVPEGAHTFSTTFNLSGEMSPGATYVPQVTLTRRGEAPQPLHSLDGGSGDTRPTMRSATVVFKSRARRTTTSPQFSDGRFYGAVDRYGLAQAFGGQMAFDAATDYQAPRHGEVSARFDTSASTLAPNSADSLNTQMTTVTAATEGKVDLLLGSSDWVGLRTARTIETFPAHRADPLAGIIYSGDSVHAGVAISTLSAHTRREGLPVNGAGGLDVDWDGSAATAWSTTFANRAPAGEPNAWNTDELHRTGSLRQSFSPTGQILQTAYAVPLIAHGGDIDNRHGDAPVAGPPTTFAGPQGHTVSGIYTAVTTPSHAKATIARTVNRGPSGLSLESVTLTPSVGVGGYWLESSRDGYNRDWAGGYHAVVISRQSPERALTDVDFSQTITVPVGFTMHVSFIGPGGVDDAQVMESGAYRIRMVDGRMRATRIVEAHR